MNEADRPRRQRIMALRYSRSGSNLGSCRPDLAAARRLISLGVKTTSAPRSRSYNLARSVRSFCNCR